LPINALLAGGESFVKTENHGFFLKMVLSQNLKLSQCLKRGSVIEVTLVLV